MFTVWLCLFVLLIGIEIITINLVSIWFALGAIGAAWVSLLTENILIQILVFTFVSVSVLLIMRPMVKKISKKKVPTNLDRVIGKVGVVTEEIKVHGVGEVLVDGKRWSAVSNKTIKNERKVKILSIDGVKLNVCEIKEED